MLSRNELQVAGALHFFASRCQGDRKGTPLQYHDSCTYRIAYCRGIPLRSPWSGRGATCRVPPRRLRNGFWWNERATLNHTCVVVGGSDSIGGNIAAGSAVANAIMREVELRGSGHEGGIGCLFGIIDDGEDGGIDTLESAGNHAFPDGTCGVFALV